jgi:hypothetical protein
MIFEVGEVWKGQGLVKRYEFLLFAPEGDCSFDFRPGKLYLVYTARLHHDIDEGFQMSSLT